MDVDHTCTSLLSQEYKVHIKAVGIITSLHFIRLVCVECGVSRLVYTSTYNVVFGGQEIRNGDHLDVLPDHKVTAHAWMC